MGNTFDSFSGGPFTFDGGTFVVNSVNWPEPDLEELERMFLLQDERD